MAINLNERLPAGTIIYIGRRQLRHASEPNEKQEVMLDTVPEAYPHTFVDFSGAKLAEVLEHAGGKQGCVVDAQKVIRDKSTLAEVNAWRNSFTVETLDRVLESAQGLDALTKAALTIPVYVDEEGNELDADEATEEQLEAATIEKRINQPYVVLNFKTAGSKLDVPKQPSDMLEAIKENATLIYEALLANLSEEEQLEKAPGLYEQMIAMAS